jgi:hypothetical protein
MQLSTQGLTGHDTARDTCSRAAIFVIGCVEAQSKML